MIKQYKKLDKGIYLENLDVFVPWKTSLSKIISFGNPKIKIHSKQRSDAVWI